MSSSSNRESPSEDAGRMDAAVDAMKQMGFGRDIIVQTVRKLLQVYSRQGWMFIEDHSYAVLLEALLETPNDSDQENADKKMNIPMQGDSEDCNAETSAPGEPSVIHSRPRSSMQAADAPLQLQNISLQQSSKGKEKEASAAGVTSDVHSPTPSARQPLHAALHAKQILSPPLPKNASSDSASHRNESEGRVMPPKRTRNYGCISDSSDDDDFVELTMSSSSNRESPSEDAGRMDAAVDAMKQMGFGRDIIVQTVRKLLQVYSRQRWMFIEDHSYAVLLEALSDQENADKKMNIPMQGDSEDCNAETSAPGEPSVIHSRPRSSMQAADAPLQLQNISLQQSSKGKEKEASAAGVTSDVHSPTPSARQALHAALHAKQILSPPLPKNASSDSASHRNESEGRVMPPKRKPCYGWISDGSDDDDFVVLAPAFPHPKRKPS